MNNTLLAAILALLITGCSITVPAINEYTIISPSCPSDARAVPANLTLKLTSTKSIASLSSKEIYYLRETTHIGSYLYSRWVDTPASMIDTALTSSLQNRRLFMTLLPTTSKGYADLSLESDLHAFYHRFLNDSQSEGLIDITYRIIDSKTKNTIASKRFIIASPAPTQDAAGGVKALSSATQQLSEETVLWLENVAKENQWIK
jgi:cholesterol transport system auxiliary component